MKLLIKIFGLVIIIAGLYFIFRTSEVIQPAGILAPDKPKQSNKFSAQNWQLDEFNFMPITTFSAKVRVLSISSYHNDKMSEFCPIDIAIGWGRMSDQNVVDKIEIKQQHRWYVWKTKSFPIPRKEIEISSANVHIIPATETVEDELDEVIRGNIIQISGKLVNVNKLNDKFVWKSSTKRNDTGSGACEILWLEQIKILQ